MKKLIFKAAILTLAGIMFVGCGKNTEPNDPKKENKVDLVLSIEPNEVYEGQTLAYKITTKDAPTENITITLSSDNTSVATVDPTVIMPKGVKETSGVVRRVSEGSAKIKIEAGENKVSVAEQTVTVKKIPPKTVALSISAAATEINAEETTEFTVTTPNAPEEDLQITVTSSDPLIASVTSPLTLKAGEGKSRLKGK